MGLIDVLLLGAVAAAVILAVRSLRRRRSGCGCGCENCTAACAKKRKRNK